MGPYTQLRHTASRHRDTVIGFLRAPRLAHDIEPRLDPWRTWFLGAALLCFDFNYGDLVRWLRGEYTDNFRDFSALADTITQLHDYPTRYGYPVVDTDSVFRSVTEGVPLRGRYFCRQQDTAARLLYDNHAPLHDNLPDVRAKFGQEEARSLHLAPPRCVAWFLPGLMINPISWVIQKGKGRIVIDATNTIRPDDEGAVNAQIPAQGT